MPNRVLKESLLTSQSVDRLSWGARCMLTALILVADDYGRFDADPRVLLAKCFPLRVGRITLKTLVQWRDELSAVDAIRLYERDGRAYGHFPAWFKHQRPARSRSKFPPPAKGSPQDVVVDGTEDHNAVRSLTIDSSSQPTQTYSEVPLNLPHMLPATIVKREAGVVKREAQSLVLHADNPQVSPRQKRQPVDGPLAPQVRELAGRMSIP